MPSMPPKQFSDKPLPAETHYSDQPLLDKPNSACFLGCSAPFADARLLLFGVPFDGTCTLRPGARFGPDAIRRESIGLETYSPYWDRDLDDYAICDAGDFEIPYGNTARVLELVEKQSAMLLAANKIPFLLGGEHLVTLGAVRALAKIHPELHIIHFDAHTDLRADWMGEPLSHASVIRRCWEIVGDGRIHSLCVRSGPRDEWDWARRHLDFHPFSLEGFDAVLEACASHPVYFTFDLDALDPSEMPGTGTPEAGGVHFTEVMAALKKMRVLNLLAADLVELSPALDSSGCSTALAAKLCREIMLLLLETRKRD